MSPVLEIIKPYNPPKYDKPDRNNRKECPNAVRVAANVAIGRNHAGVHRRSDYQDCLLLGEAVAISLLRDQKACYNEDVTGFTFTGFSGTRITV